MTTALSQNQWNGSTRNLPGPVQISKKRYGLQVFLDDSIHDDLEDHLYVGGVGGRGEVMVDEFARHVVEGYEHGGDEAGGRVHVTICSCKQRENSTSKFLVTLFLYYTDMYKVST